LLPVLLVPVYELLVLVVPSLLVLLVLDPDY
jgi:hypothetical protein